MKEAWHWKHSHFSAKLVCFLFIIRQMSTLLLIPSSSIRNIYHNFYLNFNWCFVLTRNESNLLMCFFHFISYHLFSYETYNHPLRFQSSDAGGEDGSLIKQTAS